MPPVERIPEGYEIRENVNGVVSLGKTRPVQILTEERLAVENQLERHRKARNYRLEVKGKRIVVYERTGPDAEDLSPMLRRLGGVSQGRMQAVRDMLDESARFTPVMRFTLADAEHRRFNVQRMYYRGGAVRWKDLMTTGPLDELAPPLIPLLGTDQFFELI